jgi:uncharacterized LabA/DUF88 family protein
MDSESFGMYLWERPVWTEEKRHLRAGVFYDGVTFKIVSDYYRFETGQQARLSFPGIDALVEAEVARWLGQPCRVTERHLFLGLERRPGGGVYGVSPKFEAAMRACGVRPHYLSRNRWGEKGVDTALALEVQGAMFQRRIEVAVLVATDGDFAPVARAVRQAGGHIVLLGFHLPNKGPRPLVLSPELTDAVDLVVPVSEWIGKPEAGKQDVVKGLFCTHQSAAA